MHDRKTPVQSDKITLKGVEAALRRSAARARRDAGLVGGSVVLYRDGKIIRENPNREWASQADGWRRSRPKKDR